MSDNRSPPRKIKRQNCNCGELKEQIKKLREDLQKRDALLQEQVKFLAEEIAKQSSILKAIHSRENDVDALKRMFPINTEEKLREVNESILAENRQEYIQTLKGLIEPNGIKKNLRSILMPQITYDYNVDGVQGKKSLKGLCNFYSVLIDSIQCSGSGKPEEELRKAIQLQKKRHFKSISISKINKNLPQCPK
ncbi:uncharacterized protein LOC142230262 [Haematobia irritans]|uniref:uncharacterized protein LOC142230262 n=1 Tax=Haematobia irritans TaxID=7368 RepID=UPI003F4FC062